MMQASASVSPSHPLIREYHRSLAELRSQGVEHELGLRRPFENLLAGSARLHGWRYVAESAPRPAAIAYGPMGSASMGKIYSFCLVG